MDYQQQGDGDGSHLVLGGVNTTLPPRLLQLLMGMYPEVGCTQEARNACKPRPRYLISVSFFEQTDSQLRVGWLVPRYACWRIYSKHGLRIM